MKTSLLILDNQLTVKIKFLEINSNKIELASSHMSKNINKIINKLAKNNF